MVWGVGNVAVGRRRRLRAILRWLIVCALIVGVLIVGRARLLSPLVSTHRAEPVTYEVNVGFTAFSLYRETVLFAPLSGRITPLVADGKLVARNAAVVKLENPDAAEAYKARLNDLRLEADAWRSAHEEELAAASERAVVAGQLAFDAVLDFKRGQPLDSLEGAAQSFYAARREVESLQQQWWQRREQIEGLRVLAERMEDRIRAPEAGIARILMDGFEGVMDWDVALTGDLTEDLLLRADDGVPAWYPGSEITAGAPAVRILDPIALDAVLLVAPEDVPSIGLLAAVRVTAEGVDQVVTAQVTEIGPPGGDHVLVRVSLDQALPFFFENRLWEGVLTAAEVAGLRIPPSALLSQGDDVGVFTHREGRFLWMPVEVLVDEDDQAIVAGIPGGVEVVDNPRFIRFFRLE